MILARAPKEFVSKCIPELLTTKTGPLKVDISKVIPAHVFTPLLRFWYTASFYNLVSPQSSVSDLSIIIKTPEDTSPRLPTKFDLAEDNLIKSHLSENNANIVVSIQYEIEQLSLDLGIPLLPVQSETVPDFVQLVNDIKRMRDEQLATDVVIHLVSSSDNILVSFKAHRFLLAAQSSYFYALFCSPFQESSSAEVHLTDDLFNEAIIDLTLNFFYTDKIIVEPLKSTTAKTFSPHQRRLQHHKHALRVIQKAFYAADYLGHSDTFGQAILHEMECLCHQFKCFCTDCAQLLPSMLAWSDKHIDVVPQLRRALILFYADPVHSLASLWSQRPFSLLVANIVPSAGALGNSTHAAVLKGEPLFRSRPPQTLVHEIEERIFCNVTKHNAIQTLHALHLCFSQIRTVDPEPSWSRPALDLLTPLLQYTVDMVSRFFDFYCVEYPILLSCVDGIGGGFSVDFFEFLLRHVLNDGLTDRNAGIIYQGIVRDLVGRQEVVKNMAIDDVLIKARARCAQYISKNIAYIKSEGGLRSVEKSVLKLLAEDTGIPYRSLSTKQHNFDSDFAAIFSFKPKQKQKQQQRRLSIGITRSETRPSARPRALSTESAFVARLQNHDAPLVKRENQPLITMLSYETIERGRILEEEDRNRFHPSVSALKSLDEHNRPVLRTSSSFTSLTDQLLDSASLMQQERPTRLKFELPKTPNRSKSPVMGVTSAFLQRRRKSSSGISTKGDEDQQYHATPRLGDKVELLRRPLPTLGTIKYIGPVQFAEGQYVGIELESRLGKSDGSMDGVRYFHTDPQRGLFLKPDDFIILSNQQHR